VNADPLSTTVLSIAYRLTGAGWSECDLASGNVSVTISASYLGDALGDLARAVLAIVRGEAFSRSSFDEEPGEYRWLFTRDGNRVWIRVLAFDDLWGKQSDEKGKEVFRAEASVDELAGALVTALDAVLKDYGTTGYREKWIEHDFPASEHAALAAAVGGGG
jgi:hypothetical protein